jgi:uncharacterized SAM-binding protein YcdF (DUF218 family)
MTNLTAKEVRSVSPSPELTSSPKQRAFGGLLVRKYRWGLSLPAKLLLLIVACVLLTIAFRNTYSFLATTQRVDSDVLVVEGWIHPYAIQVAANEFRNYSYQRVFSTGGPVVGKGGYINDYQTAASVGADLLKKAGIPPDLIQMVPSHVMGRDRTYSSALALRDWLHEHDVRVRSLNIVTEGAHARRTRLLFEKALGPDINVGVISVNSPDFDAKRWWHYSEGVEDVIDEGIGYLYARFVFPASSELPRSRKVTSQ